MLSRIPLWRTLRARSKTTPGGTASPAAWLAEGGPTASSDRAPQRLAHQMCYVREIDIFCDLTPSDMEWLEGVTTMLTCPKGQVIYTPGETGEVLFILKGGRVQIYRLSVEGKKLVIITLEAGTVFGEMALVGQGMYESFAEAVEPSVICVLSRAIVVQLVEMKPQVALRLLEVMGARLLETQMALEDLAFKPVPARLAALLLRLCRTHGEVVEGVSHQELADMAGTLRETATQTLDEFKAAGWIETGRRRIVIRDVEALQVAAESTRQRSGPRA